MWQFVKGDYRVMSNNSLSHGEVELKRVRSLINRDINNVTSNLNNLKVFALTYFSNLNAINTSDSGIDNLKRKAN